MHLVLYPKTFNLAVGVGIGLAGAALGRWLVHLSNDPDTASIYGVIGVLGIIGGLWVAASNALWLWRPKPSFAADEEGFSVMGKRKQPWDRFQGVGIQSLKQGGLTTNKWVTVKVGKGPTFARKKRIKWTHLSHGADDMARRIHDCAQNHHAKRVMESLITGTKDATAISAAASAERALKTARAQAPSSQGAESVESIAPGVAAQRSPQPKQKPAKTDFTDSPIKSGGGGLRGLFGG